MNYFVNYITESSILLTIFYGIYYFLFRNDSFLQFSRLFLLLGVIVSVLLPFVKIDWYLLDPVIMEIPQTSIDFASQNTTLIITKSDTFEILTFVNLLLFGFIIFSIRNLRIR